ncbi:hypothetical protein C3L33_19343, partial [Rhododendron williamsianum]
MAGQSWPLKNEQPCSENGVIFPLPPPSSLMLPESVPSTLPPPSSGDSEEEENELSSGSSKKECDEIGTNEDGKETTENSEHRVEEPKEGMIFDTAMKLICIT